MERELQEEKKKTLELNENLFNSLFEAQQDERVENPLIISTAEGKPNYESYAHLIESENSTDELLELANEELKRKQKILRKIATKLLSMNRINIGDRKLLRGIINDFN